MSAAAETERRILSDRKIPQASPVKLVTPLSSPHVTPTKNYRSGDRYFPRQQCGVDLQARYASILVPTYAEQETTTCFKKPFELPARSPPARPSLNITTHFTAANYSAFLPSIISSTSTSVATTAATPSTATTTTTTTTTSPTTVEDPRQDQMVHRALLRNELLDDVIDDIRYCYPTPVGDTEIVLPGDRPCNSAARNLFSYAPKAETPTKFSGVPTSRGFGSPLSENSQRLLRSPRKPQRKVPKNPYKVLDAPDLQDDFYLNLVDWSSQNMLSVGLNTCVYLWSANNSQVIKLCDLVNYDNDSVTSVQWTDKGELLAVGTNKGHLQIWDVQAQTRLHDLPGHQSRVGCLAWNDRLICSGSRDRSIIQRDLRAPHHTVGGERKLMAHRQEVCGLKWSPDRQYLASGGNDNQLLVWNLRRPDPCQTYSEHNAAVKALAWSPHHHGLLVSGGGTADRCLRFWNTLTGQAMQCIDTGSQVCNVAWSKHSSELVSTHGYSYNQAMSPDGEAIVTGAGDETLRFWHVFSKSGAPRTARSKLNLLHSMR